MLKLSSASEAPSTTRRRPTYNVSDVEPDAEWKAALRKRIDESLGSMAKGAQDNFEAEMKKAVSVDEQMRRTSEYSNAMATIRKLAEEEFQLELQREREERRWVAGRGMDPRWNEALKREQQDIMDSIKAQKETSSPKTAEPPENTIPSTVRKTPSMLVPERPPSPTEPERQKLEVKREPEREKEREIEPESQTVHKGRESDNYSSKHRDNTPRILRPTPSPAPSEEKPSHVDPWIISSMSDEPEESLKRHPNQMRSPAGRPSTKEPINRPMDHPLRSLSKQQPHSSQRTIPETRKPAIFPGEDAQRAFSAMWGSTASMKPAGARPFIAEAIPGRVDDAVHLSGKENGKEEEHYYETDGTRSPPREKERKPLLNDDQQRAARESIPLSDEHSSPRFASLSSNRPPESQEEPYSSVTSSGPLRQKPSYADDREYPGSQYSQKLQVRTTSTNHAARPHQVPSSGRPAMRNTFPNDERDRENWDRERDWAGDGDRHFDQYSPSRTDPTPPASSNRSTTRDYSYMPDNYDMPGADPFRREYEHNATWSPLLGTYFTTPSESKPSLAREPSYPRKRNDISSPEDVYHEYDYPAPPASIPISRPRQSPYAEESRRGWPDSHRPWDPRYDRDYAGYPCAPGGYRDSPNFHTFGGRDSGRSRDDDSQEDGAWTDKVDMTVEEKRIAPGSARIGDGAAGRGGREGGKETKRREREEKDNQDEMKRQEEEIKQKKLEEETRLKEQQLEQEAKRLEEEAVQMEEEAKKREEEYRKREQEVRREEEEYRKREQEVGREEEEQRREEEVRKREEKAKAKRMEEEAKRKEAEKEEEETRKKEEEIKRKAEYARKRVLDATRKAEETRKKEEEIRLREEELCKREEELKRREEEASLKEAERLQRQFDEEAQEKERMARRAEERQRREREQERKRQEEENRRQEEASLKEAERLQRQIDEEAQEMVGHKQPRHGLQPRSIAVKQDDMVIYQGDTLPRWYYGRVGKVMRIDEAQLEVYYDGKHQGAVKDISHFTAIVTVDKKLENHDHAMYIGHATRYMGFKNIVGTVEKMDSSRTQLKWRGRLWTFAAPSTDFAVVTGLHKPLPFPAIEDSWSHVSDSFHKDDSSYQNIDRQQGNTVTHTTAPTDGDWTVVNRSRPGSAGSNCSSSSSTGSYVQVVSNSHK